MRHYILLWIAGLQARHRKLTRQSQQQHKKHKKKAGRGSRTKTAPAQLAQLTDSEGEQETDRFHSLSVQVCFHFSEIL